MKIKKRDKNQRRGTIRISAAQDIEQLKTHDWSDPLLDQYFATVVEKLTRKHHPESPCDEQEDCPPLTAGQGTD
ncbi:MAG: hypothetical protein WAU91_13940 [Desulfatitalea sp.]